MKATDCPCHQEVLLGDDGACDYLAFGYPWCPRCMDHHRPWPDCPGVTADDLVRAEIVDLGDPTAVRAAIEASA